MAFAIHPLMFRSAVRNIITLIADYIRIMRPSLWFTYSVQDTHVEFSFRGHLNTGVPLQFSYTIQNHPDLLLNQMVYFYPCIFLNMQMCLTSVEQQLRDYENSEEDHFSLQ